MAATTDSLWTDNILEGALTSDNVMQGDMTPARNVTYALVGEAGARVLLNINSADYKMTAILQDKDGNTIYTSNVIDLPLESMVVSGSYDSTNKKVILTLQNGNTVEFSIADLVDGLVSFTDYAGNNKAGVFKASTYYGTQVTNGILSAPSVTYATYLDTAPNERFISKGTLENVITGKGLVSNTDYATDSTGGVIKTYSNYATSIVASGILGALTKQYNAYLDASNSMFIGKGTLENVIVGKGLVSNTNYATNSTGGVIKINNGHGINVSGDGYLTSYTRTYTQYQSDSNALIIGKGTLENVLTARIGDIEEALQSI